MKANQDKCHLIVSKNKNVSMHIGPFEIKNTNCEKLLGIKVDSSERVLRITYNDFHSSFENLLEKDGTVSIHVQKSAKTRNRNVKDIEKI